VTAVLVAILMQVVLRQGQPPPLPPLLPAASVQEGGGLPSLPALPQLEKIQQTSQQSVTKPPALVPVQSELRTGAPPVPSLPTDTKPPSFKLVDVPGPTVSETSNKMAPTAPTVSPLAPGTVATPCLVLERSGPVSASAGQMFSYEITVRNPGTVPAAQARLEELLPQGTRYLGGQPLARGQGDRLVWDLQNIAAGAEQRIRVDVETSQDGAWKSEATLSVAISQALHTQVTPAPLQMLTVTNPSSISVGHPVSFVLRLTNTTAAPLTDLLLEVRLSPGLEHLQGDAIEGSLGDLAPGKSREVTLDAVTTQAGQLTVVATVHSTNKPVAVANAAVTATEQPILALKLTELPASPSREQEFRVDVINRSATELREVMVTELLPEGLEFVTAEMGTYEPGARTIRWPVGTMDPWQTRQVTFRAAARTAEPQLNRVSVQASNGIEAQFYSIVRGGR
jgi:uncharacterized repeat protein (TIGR01451 family)